MSRRAVILAGGKGTRLRPYTVVLPKPLMPVGDYPILEVIVRQLVRSGFTHITMAVNHQAELIKAFFADGTKWGVAIDYSLENEPLGTMGPLTLIGDLPDHFLVMNGDILTDLDYGAFASRHERAGAIFTIASQRREQVTDYGVLEVNEGRKLTGFREKPRVQYEVSTGIYMVSRTALEMIPAGRPFGFDQLMLSMLEREVPVTVESFNGYWRDIGRPDDYLDAIDEFPELEQKLLHG